MQHQQALIRFQVLPCRKITYRWDGVRLESNVKGASYLYVVYTPYATAKSTGITENPIEGGPWIMYPGKPWAHLMIAPQKTAAVTLK